LDANSAQQRRFVSPAPPRVSRPAPWSRRAPRIVGWWPRVRVRVWLETLLVSIAVAGLFGLLGLATVDAELTREWSGQASVQVLQSMTILGEELVVSAALLQVAGFLGALAALMFALEVLVEEQSRHELIDDLLASYDRAVTVWAADEAGSAGEPTATQTP
jgi:ABC-type microcin C transport system permease subunit YejB